MGGKNNLFTEGNNMEVATTTVEHPGVLNFRYSGEDKPEPKFVKPSLVYLTGMFIVKATIQGTDTSSEVWRYYPLKISPERKGNFYRIEVSPKVLEDGYVCVDDQVFYVPIGDLVRRRINVSRIVTTRSKSTTTAATKSREQIAPASRRDSIESPPGVIFEPEISEAINLASKDQIDALQYLEDCEEGGWEIPNPSQSR